jgi:hypothetical protein
MADTAHAAELLCRNCGHSLSGAYCAACGQAEHDGHPPTLGHFIHDLVHEFLHVDGTIFRTLKALFFQPGKLTEEYWAGHIVSWVRPVRIFLIVVALHLLISTGVGPLNFQLVATKSPAGDLHLSVANGGKVPDMPKGNVPVTAEQHREFFEKFEKAYALIRYSSVLLFALAAWLLYRRQQPYFVNSPDPGAAFLQFLVPARDAGQCVGPMVFRLEQPVAAGACLFVSGVGPPVPRALVFEAVQNSGALRVPACH